MLRLHAFAPLTNISLSTAIKAGNVDSAAVVVSRSGAIVQLRLGVAPSSQPAAAKPAGGMGVLGPAWTRGEIEKPSVTVNKGTYTALEYSTEQQQRLGVDAQGKKVSPAAASPAKATTPSPAKAGAVGVIGPSWTRGEIEAPAGVQDMGGWQASVYTPEQQSRLNVDSQGNKIAIPAAAATKAPVSAAKAGAVGVIGPSWTRGEIEAPAGVQDMGGWQASVYTPEQQSRLNVDSQGNKIAIPAAAASKAPASPLPDKWESRCSAFSAQKYWFNGGKNSVSLRDPSKMVGGQLAHAAAAAAAASSAPSPLPVASKSSPSSQTKVASDVKASVVSKPAAEAKAVEVKAIEAKVVVGSDDSATPAPVSIAGGGASDASGAKKKKKKSGKK